MRFKVEFREERMMSSVVEGDKGALYTRVKGWSDYFPADSISEALAKAESYNTSGYARVISIREAP